MENLEYHIRSRRNFLQFLLGSPLLAYSGLLSYTECFAGEQNQADVTASDPEGQREKFNQVIRSSDKALNVFDFEGAARTKLSPAHYGYLASGVDDNATLRANRGAFSRVYLRPRRLIDVTKIDMSTQLFGVTWETPIILAPAGSQMAFHPDGEVATAKAAKTRRHLQILSTVSTTSIEDVVAAHGAPVWYQLYPTSSRTVTQALLRRAEAAGCPVAVLTVDSPANGNRETMLRLMQLDRQNCATCHSGGYLDHRPMFEGLDLSGVKIHTPGLTWDFVKRLKNETNMKLVLKGIVTREDALLCLDHGVDGIIVSNHGGRAEESGRATLDCLPEIVEAVNGSIPVLIDGGFRRGTDIFKALALGARAVCIGRPYLWGLAAFGQDGIEKVLDILRAELSLAMQFAGTRSLPEIERSHIGKV